MNLLQERILAFAKRGRAVPNCVVVSSRTENSAGGGGEVRPFLFVSRTLIGEHRNTHSRSVHTLHCANGRKSK